MWNLKLISRFSTVISPHFKWKRKSFICKFISERRRGSRRNLIIYIVHNTRAVVDWTRVKLFSSIKKLKAHFPLLLNSDPATVFSSSWRRRSKLELIPPPLFTFRIHVLSSYNRVQYENQELYHLKFHISCVREFHNCCDSSEDFLFLHSLATFSSFPDRFNVVSSLRWKSLNIIVLFPSRDECNLIFRCSYNSVSSMQSYFFCACRYEMEIHAEILTFSIHHSFRCFWLQSCQLFQILVFLTVRILFRLDGLWKSCMSHEIFMILLICSSRLGVSCLLCEWTNIVNVLLRFSTHDNSIFILSHTTVKLFHEIWILNLNPY